MRYICYLFALLWMLVAYRFDPPGISREFSQLISVVYLVAGMLIRAIQEEKS